ncbi:hypothetical protein [Chryseobacterium indoltheticum]|uniref:hypothetical protein n=1 Tax=Chryseobacterium indoltheticum TaxID=254 RepID=UPI0019142E0C|nr:hypothetical protein [Chryseobacterium indoltheticum]QQQ30521.1 hypothetical protein JJL46_10960 [Chryseobacterium indoltheticum]
MKIGCLLFAAAGNDKIIDQLKNGVTLNGRLYKNHIDGANQLDYLTGKSKNLVVKVLFM